VILHLLPITITRILKACPYCFPKVTECLLFGLFFVAELFWSSLFLERFLPGELLKLLELLLELLELPLEQQPPYLFRYFIFLINRLLIFVGI